MKTSLSQEAILISGPTGGLGLELTKLLSRCEVALLLVGRDLDRLNASIDMKRGNIHAIESDLASVANADSAKCLADALASTLAHISPSSIAVVSNAGVVAPIGSATENTLPDLISATAVNFLAPVLITSVCARYAGKHGLPLKVMNVSSGASSKAIPGWSAYCSTKAAARMYFDVLASETGASVSIEHFDPGVLDTRMQATIRAADTEAFSMREDFVRLKSQGKLKSPLSAALQIQAMLMRKENL